MWIQGLVYLGLASTVPARALIGSRRSLPDAVLLSQGCFINSHAVTGCIVLFPSLYGLGFRGAATWAHLGGDFEGPFGKGYGYIRYPTNPFPERRKRISGNEHDSQLTL